MAHEVRNPLTGIKLKLDTMARRRLDDRSARDIAICLQEIARLDRVVSTLLVVSRKAPAEVVTIDLAELVDERLSQVEALALTRDVRLAREGAAAAFAHRESLSRVVDNLVRNAVEASPIGAEVRVILTGAASEARLDVVDHGGGIPEDRLPELFQTVLHAQAGGDRARAVPLALAPGSPGRAARLCSRRRRHPLHRHAPLEATHAEAAPRPDR